MDRLDSQLTEFMHDTAQSVTMADEESAMTRFRTASTDRSRTRVLVAGFAAVTAAAAVVSAATWGLGDTKPAGPPSASKAETAEVSPPQNRNNNGFGTRPLGEPCAGGVVASASSVVDLAEKTGTRVYLPSEAEVDKAWTCDKASPTPIFMINDVQLAFEKDWNVDPEAYLKEYVAEWGGQIETVQGYPARVSPASKTQALHSIMIFANGEVIKLLANPDVPFDRLRDLASELALPAE